MCYSAACDVLWESGYFDPEDPWATWNMVSIINHPDLYDFILDPDQPEGENYVLRVFYPEGSYAGNRTNKGGIEFFAQPMEPRKIMQLSYEVKTKYQITITYN